MIQRIQTLFLLVAFFLNASFFFLPMYSHALSDPSGWITNGLTVALFFTIAITLYSIFLFKNRPNQIRWVKRAMFFQIIALAMCLGIFFTLGSYGFHLWDEALGMSVLLLALLLQYAAIFYIRRDEDLVRSMDRIR